MAILHHETGHPRYGNLLDRIGNRNLVQVRMDTDLDETLGTTVLGRTTRRSASLIASQHRSPGEPYMSRTLSQPANPAHRRSRTRAIQWSGLA